MSVCRLLVEDPHLRSTDHFGVMINKSSNSYLDRDPDKWVSALFSFIMQIQRLPLEKVTCPSLRTNIPYRKCSARAWSQEAGARCVNPCKEDVDKPANRLSKAKGYGQDVLGCGHLQCKDGLK